MDSEFDLDDPLVERNYTITSHKLEYTFKYLEIVFCKYYHQDSLL